MRKIRNKNFFKKGFSFVEIIIVMAIIVVLAGVVLAVISGAKIKNENKAIILMVKDYEKAIYDFMYLNNNGSYPRIYIDASDRTDCLGGSDNVCFNGIDMGVRSTDIDSGGSSPDIQDYIPSFPSKYVECGGTQLEIPFIEQLSSVDDSPRIWFKLRADDCEMGQVSGSPTGGCILCYIDIVK